MALDEEEVAERARQRITERSEGDAGFTLAQLMTFIPDARQGLVDLLAAENDGRYVYTKTFEFTAELGIADLATAVDDDEPLIISPEAVLQAKVYIVGYSYQLRIFPDRAALRLDPAKVPACALEDEKLHIKSVAGLLDTYANTVNLSGAYVPSLANVRKADQRKLIDVVVTIALATLKQTKRAAPKPAAATV